MKDRLVVREIFKEIDHLIESILKKYAQMPHEIEESINKIKSLIIEA